MTGHEPGEMTSDQPDDMTGGKPGEMTGSESAEQIRAELRTVEAELAEVRRTIEQLRERTGSRWDGPVDPAEQSALLTLVEEQEALIEGLTARRAELRERIRQNATS